MGINSLLGFFGSLTFSQPWVMTSLFVVFYLALGCIAFFRPVAAIVMYFGTSIMNPQASYPIFMDIPLAKIAAGVSLVACLCNLRKLAFRFPVTLQTMVAFLVMVYVSAMAAVQPELAEKRLEEFLKVGLMVFLTVWALKDRKDYSFFFWGMLASLFYNILKNLVETQTKEAWVAIQGVAGWINDSNDWALALAMGLPLFYAALALYWDRGWKARIVLGVAAIGGLLTLTLTSSRGGFLAAATSGLVFLLMDRKPWRAVWVGGIIAVVVVLYMPGSYLERVEGIFGLEGKATSAWDKPVEDDDEYSGVERVHYWRVAYEIMRENPLNGVGWGNFITEFARRENLDKGVVAHSTWFQVGAEAGEITLALYIIMIVFSIASALRTWRRSRKAGDVWGDVHSRVIVSGLIAFCVGATFLSRENSELLFIYIAMSAVLPALVPCGQSAAIPVQRAAEGRRAFEGSRVGS